MNHSTAALLQTGLNEISIARMDGAVIKKHGRIYGSADFRDHGLQPLARGQCFWNSVNMVVEHRDRFDYVEGVAACPGCVMHHAWIAPKASARTALDPTWHRQDPTACAYKGLVVPLPLITETLQRLMPTVEDSYVIRGFLPEIARYPDLMEQLVDAQPR